MKPSLFPALRMPIFWAALLLCGAGTAEAQVAGKPPEHVRLTATLYRDPFSELNRLDGPNEFVRGEHLFLRVEGVPEKGWHTYPLLKADLAPGQPEAQLPRVRFLNQSAFVPLGQPTEEPTPELHDYHDASLGIMREYPGPFVWTWEVLLRPTAPVGPGALQLQIHIEVCENSCIWETHTLSVPVTVSPSPPLPLTSEVQEILKNLPSALPLEPGNQSRLAVPGNRADSSQTLPPREACRDRMVGVFAGDLAGEYIGHFGGQRPLGHHPQGSPRGGLVSLVTPCVFPMIPITVSFFLKQGEKKEHATRLDARLRSTARRSWRS